MSIQENLHQLFLLDQQVRGLRSRLDTAINRQEAQQRKLEQLQQQQRELDDQVKHVSAKAATLEHESNDVEQRIEQHRQKMNTVTSNKEYSALLVEVNTLKAEKGKKEEEALIEMEQRDRLAQDLSDLSAKVAEQEKLVHQAASEVEARRAEVGDRLEQVTAERDAARQHVPADVLAVFERSAYSHDGEAMAPVVEESRRHRDYSCGGCYMSIPFERLNVLMSRDELVSCPSCGRILYVDKELKTSIGAK